LTGQPISVVDAGAVYDGRSLTTNLMWVAQGVWVGTWFAASIEAGVPKAHKDTILDAGYEDAVRTLIYTGRPLRVLRTPYIED
jgi:NAD(P)H-dependent flavin oxidoreductase YrpB (nitropropane dioxygenase family)